MLGMLDLAKISLSHLSFACYLPKKIHGMQGLPCRVSQSTTCTRSYRSSTKGELPCIEAPEDEQINQDDIPSPQRPSVQTCQCPAHAY